MGLLDILKGKQPLKRCGEPEWHGMAFDIDDVRIPEPIRAMVAADYRLGYTLCFTDTDMGGEWWLLDGEKLIEAYWLK